MHDLFKDYGKETGRITGYPSSGAGFLAVREGLDSVPLLMPTYIA